MTLAQLADHICGIVNQNETEDLARCKAYLQRRFEMIWNDQLWKDSLFEYTQTLSSSGYTVLSTWLPTRKILLLPTQIQQVVALRTDTVHLNVESSELFYRQDYDTFASTGQTRQYRLLGACVWDLDVATALYLNAATAGVAVLLDSVLSDGVTQSRQTITSIVGSSAIASLFTLLALSKPSGSAVNVGTAQTGAVYITNNFPTAQDFTWVTTPASDNAIRMTLQPGQSAVMGVPQSQNPGAQYIAAFDAGFSGVPNSTSNVGDNFTGTIIYNADTTWTATTGTPIVSLAATDTSALKRQRLQLFGTVPEAAVIRVLGKVKAPTFEADGDEPGLTGVENCLIEFALADMYRRSRQLGKAQLCAQQGAQLLDQLKRVQTVQQAHNKRLIPEGGYNDEYGMNTGGRSGLSF